MPIRKPEKIVQEIRGIALSDDERIGQIISNAIRIKYGTKDFEKRLFYIEDDELLKLLQKYFLKRNPPKKSTKWLTIEKNYR